MAIVERICPNCGATNPSDRDLCVRCNTNLVLLTSTRQSQLPARIGGASVAALAVGAGALVLRAGVQLLARELLGWSSRGLARKTLSTPLTSEESPDWIVRGWRAWSIHTGTNESTGSEHFEWHIKRKDSK